MKIFGFISLTVVILFISNLCYTSFGLYAEDISKCDAELLHTFDSGVFKNNLLYFGESSNFTFSEKDSVKKSISDLVADKSHQYRILTISKGAIHTSIYRAFIERLPDNSSIKTIIITVNLRSFGINWIESNLETNLSRAEIFYKKYPAVLKKLMLSFKMYDNQPVFKRKKTIQFHYSHDKFQLRSKKFETIAEWDKVVFHNGILDASGNKDQKKTEIACHFIKNYAFVLDEKNPRIRDLDAIIEICKSRKINLIFNLLPENHERAAELCGEDLKILMLTNVLFLKNRYSEKTLFVNNFALLKDSCFIDRDWPTEHYNYFGREAIASSIDQELKKNQFE